MTEILDKLYIELATVVSPETKTGREIRLEMGIRERNSMIRKLRELVHQHADLATELSAEIERLLA